ncbi:MAG TPA: hypothetical protein PKD78_05740, partial [Saprospiraceae bacterium]|nr:hypothetical protein [Saprospiraceae bacterium]
MNRLLFLFTFLLGFVACRHETPDPPAGEKKIYFTGITSVDDVGQALGSADPSDWRTDDSWEAQEKSLFPSTALLACNLSDSVQVYQFPNPCRDVFALGFRTQSGLTWRFRIVDENFKLLREYD